MNAGFRIFAAVVILLALYATPSLAATTSTPFICGAGNGGLALTCGGTVTVDDVANLVTLTFTTFSSPSGDPVLDSGGIMLPGAATQNNTTTNSGNAAAPPAGNSGVYVAGNFQGDFDAEITSALSNCSNCLGDGNAPFSIVFGYDGTDFTASQVVGVPNRTGSCDGFHDNLWGCLHVFRFTGDITSEFVPLRVAGEVPEPGTLILLGAGLVGLGVIARRKIGR